MLRFSKIPIVVLAGFVLIFPLICAGIPALHGYVSLMVFAGIYCLITIGLSLLMGYAGQISLGHAAFFGVGAYVSGIATVRFGLNPWLCMTGGMLVAAVVAALVGAPSFRLKGHYLAMATLAFGLIVNIIFREESTWTGGPDGLSRIPGLSIYGFMFKSTTSFYYLVWGIVLAVFLFAINVLQSPAGRALRALHTSESAAKAMGIDIARCKIIIFVFSAVLASLAGSLYAHFMKFINPSSFNLLFSIKLLIMITLGGMQSIWGAVAGAVLITFLSMEWLQFFQEYESIVFGSILLAVIIFLPEGLTGLPNMLAGRGKKSWRR